MARFSQPTGKFRVWDQGGDPYQHPDLQVNWDTLDAIIGGPGGGGVWPPSGQSIYSLLTAIQVATAPLGSYMMWHRFDATIPLPTTISGAGWVECNGQTILAANHNLVDGNGVHLGDVTVPDFRNAFPLGADSTLNLGVASSSGQGSAFSPGIGGRGGSNAAAAHSHAIPNHYHEHTHIHEVGNVLGGGFETSDAGANGVGHAATGTGQSVSLPSHNHHFDLYTSNAKVPDDANYRLIDSPNDNSQTQRPNTSLQKLATSGTGSDPTGGTIGDSITLVASQDVRPYHVGVLFLIRVKNS